MLRHRRDSPFQWINEGNIKTYCERLSRHRILFAHQSVGRNILQGVSEITSAADGLTIKELNLDTSFEDPCLFHINIGKNHDPISKLNAYSDLLCTEPDMGFDLICLKFCYVDILYTTDIESLFRHYIDVVDRIRAKFPNLIIMHISTPLTFSKLSYKDHISSVFGGPTLAVLNNVKRYQFNGLVLEKYGPRDQIFDLAHWESTEPDGTRSYFDYKNDKICQLSRKYSSDGGHLNLIGRSWIAYYFLKSLYEALLDKH